METVEREVMVPAAPGDVWPAVADSHEISAWFGAAADVDVRPGGRGVFRWPDGAERHVVVEDVEPARRLAFRWLPFQRTASGEVVPVPSTRVEITLDQVPGGTRVRVVEQRAFAIGAARARGEHPRMGEWPRAREDAGAGEHGRPSAPARPSAAPRASGAGRASAALAGARAGVGS